MPPLSEQYGGESGSQVREFLRVTGIKWSYKSKHLVIDHTEKWQGAFTSPEYLL